MRVLASAAIALIASLLAGSAVTVLLAEWAAADQSYIIAFIAVLPVSMIVTAILLLAGAVAIEPRRGITAATKVLLAGIAILLAAVSVLEIFDSASSTVAWRAVRFHSALALSWAAMVVIQWLAFRWRATR
jgi:hypothetical protein